MTILATPLQLNSDSALLTSSPGGQKDWVVSNQRFGALLDAQALAIKIASTQLADCPIYEKMYIAQAPIIPPIQIIALDDLVATPPTPVTINATSP